MGLDDNAGVVFIPGRRGLIDNDVSHLVLDKGKLMLYCELNNPVTQLFLVFRTVRNFADLIKVIAMWLCYIKFHTISPP